MMTSCYFHSSNDDLRVSDGLNMVLVPWSPVWGSWLLKVPYRFTQREREREGGRESKRERERERKIERERE